MKYFNELYIRWVFDDKTEGDDLIAYYVKNKKPSDKVVIVSVIQEEKIKEIMIAYEDKYFKTKMVRV